MNLIAPHYCCSCDEIGSLLCDSCRYNIISEPFESCVSCGKRLAGKNGLCHNCQLPYERIWCAGWRSDGVRQLIDQFKFGNAKAAYEPLAALLDARLPDLPRSVVIVPVPTVASHIRQRGYDHTLLIARELATRRGLRVETHLQRVTDTKQRDANHAQRQHQAREAFACRAALDPDVTYLLIDDVVTTGATIKYATKELRKAGAKTVWVAVVSRQPLD